MKVLIKDKDNQVLFETNKAAYCEVVEDDYDYTKVETRTSGNMVMNDIKTMKTYRFTDAPVVHEEEDNIKN